MAAVSSTGGAGGLIGRRIGGCLLDRDGPRYQITDEAVHAYKLLGYTMYDAQWSVIGRVTADEDKGDTNESLCDYIMRSKCDYRTALYLDSSICGPLSRE